MLKVSNLFLFIDSLFLLSLLRSFRNILGKSSKARQTCDSFLVFIWNWMSNGYQNEKSYDDIYWKRLVVISKILLFMCCFICLSYLIYLCSQTFIYVPYFCLLLFQYNFSTWWSHNIRKLNRYLLNGWQNDNIDKNGCLRQSTTQINMNIWPILTGIHFLQSYSSTIKLCQLICRMEEDRIRLYRRHSAYDNLSIINIDLV